MESPPDAAIPCHFADRQRASVQRAKSDTDAYIREVAGRSPAKQIADAKALLDAGTINECG